jgi:hypothetical protein
MTLWDMMAIIPWITAWIIQSTMAITCMTVWLATMTMIRATCDIMAGIMGVIGTTVITGTMGNTGTMVTAAAGQLGVIINGFVSADGVNPRTNTSQPASLISAAGKVAEAGWSGHIPRVS